MAGLLRGLAFLACAGACAAYAGPGLAVARPLVPVRPLLASAIQSVQQPRGARLRLRPPSRAAPTLAIRDEAAVASDLDGVEAAGSYQGAITQTVLIALLASAFCAGIWVVRGQELAFQFFAGYVIEESLSVDNLFVFKLIFDFFTVTGAAQRKCLNWGIWAAAVLRLTMISLGVEAVQHFKPVLLVFAAILLLSSGTILFESLGGDKEEPDLANNAVVKLCGRLFATSERMDGDRFFTVERGVRVATPLLVALLCIEVSDVVFAVDSVPAVLGVTEDPFIAFTSNMFAIFGLRALFRVLSTLVSDFEYLQVCTAEVLRVVCPADVLLLLLLLAVGW
jgi:TerC family integral membrane protein